MSKKKPKLDIENYSVAKLVTELHEYFRNSQAYYEVKQGEILGKLGTADDSEQEQKLTEAMKIVTKKMSFFGALNDVLSAADRLVHAKAMVSELELDQDFYGENQE